MGSDQGDEGTVRQMDGRPSGEWAFGRSDCGQWTDRPQGISERSLNDGQAVLRIRKCQQGLNYFKIMWVILTAISQGRKQKVGALSSKALL